MDKIRVMIVDDQPVVREGLKMILSLCREVEVVYIASSGEEAVKVCEQKSVEVVLMDIRMTGMNGVEATGIIKERFPMIKVIILTTFNDDEYIFEALKNGADSYLLKDADSEEIINAIKLIYAGGNVFHHNIAAKLVDRVSSASSKPSGEAGEDNETLTHREVEIAKLIAEGLSNKEISDTLYITVGTVKNHITSILSKLGVRHRTQIALYIINKKT